MNNLNQVLIEGKLVKNPELSHTTDGTAVCTFSVASNRFIREKLNDEFQKEVSFFDITALTELANNCASNLKKGRGVRIIGRLKQDRWEGPKGKIHSKVYIVADHVIFKPEVRKEENHESKKSE